MNINQTVKGSDLILGQEADCLQAVDAHHAAVISLCFVDCDMSKFLGNGKAETLFSCVLVVWFVLRLLWSLQCM